MKRRITVICLLLVIIFNLPVFAEYTLPTGLWYANITRSSATVSGAVSRTPETWKFKYEDQEFVILDTFQKDGKTLFFVMTESIYGNHVYSTATSEPYGWFNPDDTNNIAYWLNNDFWNNGNGGKALPEGIKSHIVSNKWVTEPLRDDAGTGHVPDGYKSTSLPPSANCKLALLSDWEWKAYINKIGYPGSTWFFRSVRTVDIKNSTSNIIAGTNAVGYNGTVAATGTGRGIRPVFMLDSAFFADCKISGAGSEVVKIIDSYCNPSLYSEDERREIFGWPDAVISQINGNAVIGQTIEVEYTYYGTFPEYGTEFRWLRSDNIDSGYAEISGANKKNYKITEADSDKYLRVEILPKSKSVMSPEGYWCESSPIGPVFGTSKVGQAIAEVRDASAQNVMAVVEKYNAVFMVDTGFNGLADEEKNNAVVIFANADFSTIEELRREYERATALAKLNGNKNVSMMADYIVDELHLDLARYNNLTNKDDVHQAIADKNYTSFKDFEKDFNEAVCILDVNNSDRNTIKNVLMSHRYIFTADLSILSEYQLGLVGVDVLSKTYSSFSELDKAVTDAVSVAKENRDVPHSPMISDIVEGKGNTVIDGIGFVPVIPKNDAVYEAMRGNYIDLEQAEWARESIEALTEKGIVSGYGDGAFCPNATLTREEFVKIIVSAFYPDAQGFKTTAEFKDVESGKWYSLYINIATEKGIINGVSDTEFGIGRNITREDMAVIICRAVGKDLVNIGLKFTDSYDIADYAKNAVSVLVSEKLISGYEDGSFKPKQTATRAMAAKVIYDILKAENEI